MKSKAFVLFLLAGISLLSPVFGSQPDSLGLFVYGDKSGKEKIIRSPAQWEKKRTQILDGMQEVMGPLPDRSNLPPLNIRFTDSLKEKGYTRYTIRFTVAENEDLPAYLYIPAGTQKKLPAMLVLHETDDIGKASSAGSGTKANRAYAKELAERGYIVIAPDYPSFGDLKDYNFDTDRYQSGTMKAIFNHMRCVDLLQARSDVDPERIGVIGHSLGGHNSLFVSAFDKRLKVIVSSCGWTLFSHYNIGEELSKSYGGRLGPWAQSRYMPLIKTKYNADNKQVPFDFDGIIATLAPRPFFSNSPLNDTNFDVNGVKKGIANARHVYRLFKADDKLQVRYPVAAHDFPPAVRLEAYQFIDKVLKHSPREHKL